MQSDVWFTGQPNQDRRIVFALDSGRKVWVDAFYYHGTYDGLLEGVPDEEFNRMTVENELEKASKRFYNFPAVLVAPTLDSISNARLPRCCCMAQVTSRPTDSSEMYSALVAVWLCDPFFDKPLRNVVVDAVKSIDWESHCENFSD